MGVTAIPYADAAVSYGHVGGGAGTFSIVTHAGATAGNYKKSTTASDTVTVSFTGRALYLLADTLVGGGAASCTVDGVTAAPVVSFGNGCLFRQGSNVQGDYARVLVPLARGLADGPHTATLTVLASGLVTVDTFLAVSGAPAGVSSGVLVAVGDSWTLGYGSSNLNTMGCVGQLATLLGMATSKPVTVVNKGINGDGLFAFDGTHTGGMYSLYNDVLPATPRYVTMLFGANDLRLAYMANSAGDYARHYAASLAFLEDTLDTTQVKVAVCTCPPPTPYYTFAPMQAVGSNTNLFSSGSDGYLLAASALRRVASAFPWCRVADAYNALEGRTDSYLVPNYNGDLGLHPNDEGHGVIAAEFLGALGA